MRLNLCRINGNVGERLTISYDTTDRALYASDAPNEPLDTPPLPSSGAAVEYCRAAWQNDGAGVWGFEWTIDEIK